MEVNSLATGYDGSIRINTKIDSKGFNQGLNAITGSLKKLAGAVGVAFGVASLVAFGKQAVQIASDLTEVQNVVETAFGTMSSQVDAWAKNSIKQFGMSELAAKRMASTYMAMNAGMGLNGQGAADMAMRTAERAADISSFYNKSIDESDTMLKSIWTGETESLKQIGVVMTQTNLDAYALANGFGKTTQQMTQSEQVMLRYQYVMNQTRLAAGDFVKTQDSWANQTRILSEQWKQFLGIIGQGLIQVLTPALKFLNQMVGVLIQWAQTFTAITGAIFGKQQAQANASAAAVGNVADASNAAADGQNALAGATKKAGKEAKGALASFDQLNVLERGAADAGAVGTGIAAGAGAAVSVPAMTGEIGADVKVSPIVESTVNKLRSLFEPLQKINLDNLKSSLDRLKEAMKPITSKLFEALEWAYKEIFVPFANWVISSAVPTFLDVLSGALAVLNSVLDALKPLGIWLWDNFLQPIAAWTGGVIVTVLKWLAEKLTAIGDWISSNQTMVQDFAIILGGVAGAILAVKGAIIAVKTAFKVASAVSSIFANGLNLQLLPMTAIVVAIGAIIGIIIVCIRHWDEIKAVALDCWNKIKEAWNKAGDWFHKNVTEPIGNFFTGLWDGIKGAFTKARSTSSKKPLRAM
nr:MAG TPA: minor tail protein [Caudoviricetes sp.]